MRTVLNGAFLACAAAIAACASGGQGESIAPTAASGGNSAASSSGGAAAVTPMRWTPSAPYPVVDKARLRQLVREHQFDGLQALLEGYRAELLKDPAHWNDAQEWLLTRAYLAISEARPDNQADLDLWSRTHPESPEAHIALAFLFLDLGWNARGGKWSKDTPANQMQSLVTLHDIAADHARKALELQPDSPIPYRVLLRMSQSNGLQELAATANEALAKFPYSYLLRVHAMEQLQPRWYGSYAAMSSFAETSQKFAPQNPQLRVLLGFPCWARGRDYEAAGNDRDAYDQYTQALAYGDELDFYDSRIAVERRLGMNNEAARDQETMDRLFPL